MKRIEKRIVLLLLVLLGVAFPLSSQNIEVINLLSGERKSGLFTIKGRLDTTFNVDAVKLRVNNGPWEMARGTGRWTFQVNSRDITMDSQYRYDPVTEDFVLTYRRGPVYGDVEIVIAAFSPGGSILQQKTLNVNIVPEAPTSEVRPATYQHTDPIFVALAAAPDVAIYYSTTGDDPILYGLLYTDPFLLDEDTIVKAVAISGNNVTSEVITRDIRVDTALGPDYFIEYYSDAGLTEPLGQDPYLKAGTYYLKITASEAPTPTPSINITAEGTANTVTGDALDVIGATLFRYTRTIGYDGGAVGAVKEVITIGGSPPVNTAEMAAYTDTVEPGPGSIIIAGGALETNDPTPELSISSTGADYMRLALSQPELAGAPWIEYTATYDEFDISPGGVSAKTVWVQFSDLAGNIRSTPASNTIAYNNLTDSFDIQYYANSNLTISLGKDPYLAAGTYYLKITANKDLPSNPAVSIAAEGTANDVSNGGTEKMEAGVYRYRRVIARDVAAVGSVRETILVKGISPSNAASRAAYTDTNPPAVTMGSNIDWTNSTAALNATVTDGSPLSFEWDKPLGDGTVEFGDPTVENTTISGIAGEQETFTLRLVATDAAGNAASDTLTFKWDQKAPNGSLLINYGNTYANSVNVNLDIIAFDTGGSGMSQMTISNQSGFVGASQETYAATKAWVLDSLDGEKTVYIKFTDLAGNESPVYDDSITLDSTAPAAVTGFTADAPPATNRIDLSWTNPVADFEGVMIVTRRIDAVSWTPTDGIAYEEGQYVAEGVQVKYIGTSQNYSHTGVANDGATYHYRAFAFDKAKNYSTTPADTSASLPDETPPGEVIYFTATSGDGEVVLSWADPPDSDFAGVMIRRSTSGYPASFDAGDPVPHSGSPHTDLGRTNGTTYYYTAFTYDMEVPRNYSAGTKALATPGSSDTQPPGKVSNLTTTPGNGRVTLSWTNPTDSDFAGVIIRRLSGTPPTSIIAGDLVYYGSGTTVEDTGLTNGTTYYYSVFTYDGVPNHSERVEASATPQDTGAPTVLSTDPTDLSTEIPVNTTIKVNFSEAMKEPTITGSTFTLYQGENAISGTVDYNDLNHSATFVPDSGLDYGTEYTVTVTTGVQDAAGNALETEVVWTFTTRSSGYWDILVWDEDDWN